MIEDTANIETAPLVDFVVFDPSANASVNEYVVIFDQMADILVDLNANSNVNPNEIDPNANANVNLNEMNPTVVMLHLNLNEEDQIENILIRTEKFRHLSLHQR